VHKWSTRHENKGAGLRFIAFLSIRLPGAYLIGLLLSFGTLKLAKLANDFNLVSAEGLEPSTP
jgi:hypothetical protein